MPAMYFGSGQKLDTEAEQLMPNQPWKGIRGIGNPLRHEYDSLEDHLIWEAVRGCPSLANDCRAALGWMQSE